MKFINLLIEMTRFSLTRKALALKIQMRPETLAKKIKGKSDFTYPELISIRDAINPDLTLEYLFREDFDEKRN